MIEKGKNYYYFSILVDLKFGNGAEHVPVFISLQEPLFFLLHSLLRI